MRRLEIALRRLPESAAFSGLTAAWLHGLDVEPCNPIEATVSKHAGISGRAHIALRRSELDGDDITRARGMPATSVARTISDLCAKLSLVEAVVIADAALHHGLTSVPDLKSWAESKRRRHGIRSLRPRDMSPSRPRSHRWNHVCACCLCCRGFRGRKPRSRFTTAQAGSLSVSTCTTQSMGSQLNTTERSTATPSCKTAGDKTRLSGAGVTLVAIHRRRRAGEARCRREPSSLVSSDAVSTGKIPLRPATRLPTTATASGSSSVNVATTIDSGSGSRAGLLSPR